MSDKEQQFSDLKQLFTKICKPAQASDLPRIYADDAYAKKSIKRQATAAAIEAGTADSSQLKRHSVVQACTARNHDAAFSGCNHRQRRRTLQRNFQRSFFYACCQCETVC